MATDSCADEASAIGLALRAAAMTPLSRYLSAALLILLVFLYNLFEFHFLRDLLRGFLGDLVVLTFNPASKIYDGVASKCRILHGRYSPTPWLSSPHLQTAFLHFFGRAPSVTYRRQLFYTRDGGTIALDWLFVSDGGSSDEVKAISKDDSTPIVIVIPGLTSDSASPYVKHLAYMMAKQGWNVVVSNHRGLAGISITSDCFYNAGWTEDIREVVNHLHREYPKAHLFAVGTSVGANILVKYLGEVGENTPIAGAASICSPWDLVVCDRFLSRNPVQRLYNRALTVGLKDYAKLHQSALTRLANWEGITKVHKDYIIFSELVVNLLGSVRIESSHFSKNWTCDHEYLYLDINSFLVREFDDHATRIVGKFETVDTFYRCSSSVNFTRNVVVPLLCISALDDPLCTREAIPWDECRANKNIVLATTTHGGHLAYFRGLTAKSLWWVEAVQEFLSVLRASPFMHQQKKEQIQGSHSRLLESLIDKGPFISITEDGMIAATTNDAGHNEHGQELAEITQVEQSGGRRTDADTDLQQTAILSGQEIQEEDKENAALGALSSVKRSINKLSRQHRTSMWLLVYISIVTTWPLVGTALYIVFRRKLRGFLPAAWIKRN